MDDTRLAETGTEPAGTGRVLLIACGAIAREILAVLKLNGWDHMDLTCLPAKWHMTPDRIVDGVADAVAANRGRYEAMFVAYADCGTGGLLEAKCAELGVGMIAGPHCYSFFEGNDTFAALGEDEIAAFYLTDFLVRQFDAFFWRPMGLDRHPELRDMYFGNYEKLVYQAQTDDPALTAKAEDCARRMGLPLERRYTGYGDLPAALAAL
ncbi:MAG: DUF1638 domain-containing protein [Pseudomonadota bacterium]